LLHLRTLLVHQLLLEPALLVLVVHVLVILISCKTADNYTNYIHSCHRKRNKILALFEQLVTWFTPVDAGLNQRERAARHLLVSVGLITTAFALLYVAVSAWVGFSYGIWLMLLNFVLLWLGLFLFRSTGWLRLSAHLYLVNCTFVAILGSSFFSGGLYSPVTPWFILIPVAAVLLLGYSRDTLLWLLVACAVPIGYGIADMSGYTFKVLYLPEATRIFSIMCITGLVLILFLVALTFDYNRNQAMQELQAKNEALDRAREQAEEATRMLENLATMDTLTNVPNRRAFDLASVKEWRRCLREDLPISFIMIDVDHFKQYNDNYGHGAGDECLARIAKVIDSCIHRPGDILARYGGEEFAAVMSDTNSEGALRMAQKFHAAIAESAIPHEHSTVSDHITISIGVATTTRASELTLEKLSEAADKMLYQAKESGRSMTRAIEI
jgi:diguanylate cyclase (GGDEF)-like protein